VFFFIKPDPIKIQQKLNQIVRRGDRPTYRQGLDFTVAPDGFNLDRHRILLGRDCFPTARRQMLNWRMFEIGWVRLCWEDAPISVGVTVASLIWLGVAWSLCPVRIVSVVDEPRRFGFSFATLPDHEECGEERFLVEWLESGEVWFEIFAISKPRHWLARLGTPIVRILQKRFAQAAMNAMLTGVQQFQR
jgi:uncharacterized protein (UPF0548 family)